MFKIQPLSQSDPKWKNNLLGQDKVSTLGYYGCLLTCLTMTANGLGFNETPATLNEKMKAVGGFQGPFIIPRMLPRALTGLQFKRHISCHTQNAPLAEIDATLAAGLPVIVEVDYSPKAGMQNHWVVLTGKKGDDYIIQDPYPYPAETREVTLKGRYGFAGPLGKIITGALWLEGSPSGAVSSPAAPVAPAAPVTPEPKAALKPIPTSGFAVYAQADGLALRTAPRVTADNLIKRLPLKMKLYVIEPAEAAKSKIGQNNQWIKVQETGEGHEGYTAAWYVAVEEQPTAVPAAPNPVTVAPAPAQTPIPIAPTPAQTPAAGEPMRIFAAAEGLALRREPVVSEASLIKRLPLGAEFVVLESAAEAEAKLGVNGQWLKVRDVESEEGFVAAWFVSKTRQDPPLGVIEQDKKPTPAPQQGDKLVVRAIDDLLALRRQPLISDATLIRRLPIHSELLVIEPAEGALAKIGKVNQWLNVRDSSGVEGFVAAWFVIQRPLANNP